MSRLIAFSGSHGTGKTTSAYKKTLDFKYNHPELSVHALVDQEAFCPFPINQTATQESQLWLFTNKIDRELYLLNRFDVVVTDRTTVDIIAYTAFMGFDSMAMMMFETAKNYISKYQQIIFKKIIYNDYCYSDGIRDAIDQAFRNKIETLMLGLYEQLSESASLTGVIKYI